MAVVGSATLLWYGQTGNYDDAGNKDFTAVYQVIVDDPLDGPAVVVQASGLPSLGSTYSFGNDSDSRAVCRALRPQRIDIARLVYEVVATWSVKPFDTQQKEDSNGNPTSNPLEYRNEYDIGKAQFSEAAEKVKNRVALPNRPPGTDGPATNSAGVVFVPGLERDVSNTVVRVGKYLAAFPTVLSERFQDAVNFNEFVIHLPGGAWVIDPYKAKCQNIGGTYMVERNKGVVYRFWKVDFEVHIRKRGWREEVADRGFHRLPQFGVAGTPEENLSPSDFAPHFAPVVRITDPNGFPVEEPVLLNLQGQPLAANQPAKYITYSKYDELDFNELGL